MAAPTVQDYRVMEFKEAADKPKDYSFVEELSAPKGKSDFLRKNLAEYGDKVMSLANDYSKGYLDNMTFDQLCQIRGTVERLRAAIQADSNEFFIREGDFAPDTAKAWLYLSGIERSVMQRIKRNEGGLAEL